MDDTARGLLRKLLEASAVSNGPDFTADGGIVIDAFVFVDEAEADLIRELWPTHGPLLRDILPDRGPAV